MKISQVHSQPYFLTPLQPNPGYPLFIFLPGLGETTQLVRLETAGLETAFNVRCLMLPPQELSSWDILSQQVVDLTQAALETEQPKSVYLCVSQKLDAVPQKTVMQEGNVGLLD
jgi:hypothetical protein